MYDIAIIGGGPGGYAAAEKAGKQRLCFIAQNYMTMLERVKSMVCELKVLSSIIKK